LIFQQVLKNAAAEGGYISLISAMITPVFLIVASGTLVNATLQRMTRVTDRARALIDLVAADHKENEHEQERIHVRWLMTYRSRSNWVERALISYYVAISSFIASSLAIAFDRFMHDAAPWLAVYLVVGGALMLFAGTMCLLVETTIAAGTLRDEIAHADELISHNEPAPAAARKAEGRAL
jgi:hypothetical protein